jgi:hypothetical protein
VFSLSIMRTRQASCVRNLLFWLGPVAWTGEKAPKLVHVVYTRAALRGVVDRQRDPYVLSSNVVVHMYRTTTSPLQNEISCAHTPGRYKQSCNSLSRICLSLSVATVF